MCIRDRPQSHSLATQARIDLAQLANDDFILFPRAVSPHYHDLIISRCVAAGFSPRIRHETRLWQTVVAMVAHEMGVALVPQTLAMLGQPGVHYGELEGSGAPSQIQAIRLEDKPSAAAESFLGLLKSLIKPAAGGR